MRKLYIIHLFFIYFSDYFIFYRCNNQHTDTITVFYKACINSNVRKKICIPIFKNTIYLSSTVMLSWNIMMNLKASHNDTLHHCGGLEARTECYMAGAQIGIWLFLKRIKQYGEPTLHRVWFPSWVPMSDSVIGWTTIWAAIAPSLPWRFICIGSRLRTGCGKGKITCMLSAPTSSFKKC